MHLPIKILRLNFRFVMVQVSYSKRTYIYVCTHTNAHMWNVNIDLVHSRKEQSHESGQCTTML